jgi:hypothetical protein
VERQEHAFPHVQAAPVQLAQVQLFGSDALVVVSFFSVFIVGSSVLKSGASVDIGNLLADDALVLNEGADIAETSHHSTFATCHS